MNRFGKILYQIDHVLTNSPAGRPGPVASSSRRPIIGQGLVIMWLLAAARCSVNSKQADAQCQIRC